MEIANWMRATEIKLARDISGNVQRGKFYCPLMEANEREILVSPATIMQKISLVHDCSNAHCEFRNEMNTSVEEREVVTDRKMIYCHDMSHQTFLLNRFMLGEMWRYSQDESEN